MKKTLLLAALLTLGASTMAWAGPQGCPVCGPQGGQPFGPPPCGMQRPENCVKPPKGDIEKKLKLTEPYERWSMK